MMDLAATARELGVPLEILVMGVCLLSSFPLAAMYSRIPASQPATRHLFSLLATSALSVGVFGVMGLVCMLVPTLATYALVRVAGHHHWTPVAVFVGTLAHLSYVQLEAQLWEAGNPDYIDVSAPLMVLTIKLSSFAWSVYDGTRPDKDLHADMRPYAIREVPDLLEFLGFVFFFASFWVGPAFDYVDYYQFTRSQGVYKRIPSCAVPAMKVLGLGIALLVAFISLDSYWSPSYYRDRRFITETNVIQKILLIQVAGFSTRAKLSAAWKVAESACILTGIGYNGVGLKTKRESFDRMTNIIVREVELGQSPKAIIDAWNIKTSNWLKRCVYLRATWGGNKPGGLATALTNLSSAFWHGFHAGYYLSFLSATMFILAGRVTRRALRPFFTTLGSPLLPYKPLYDVLGFVFTMGILNYIFMPFIVWHADASLRIWGSVYGLGHLALITAIVLLDTLGGGQYLVKRVLPRMIKQNVDDKLAHEHVDGGASASASATSNRKQRFKSQ
ncbi:Lysophospholipid acyltransferase [Polyrhizophydium stewartii]|uniref:Lysophospholipid acyltransferase n=1 Tax=Polyrhizophydium stewartii TaxID=2732419 RepID=A0ABR4MY56_9FUNG|nr:lysophospholipid acyltransferase [Polyrhizophydium stewartii]